jgi:uncharacterized protein YndB with AHSA1/START domain
LHKHSHNKHIGRAEVGMREETNTKVRREVELDAAPAAVWDALTRPELLEQWFEAEVELDPRPGGAGHFVGADGEHRTVRVDDVDEGRRLAFTWWPDGGRDELTSKVELVLTPTPVGTRLVVTESPSTARAGAASAGPAWAWRLDLLLLLLFALVRA